MSSAFTFAEAFALMDTFSSAKHVQITFKLNPRLQQLLINADRKDKTQRGARLAIDFTIKVAREPSGCLLFRFRLNGKQCWTFGNMSGRKWL